MITITDEQYIKIDLVDKLLGALSVDQLREFTESEQIVAVLKGTANNSGLLRGLIQENAMHSMELMTLRNEVMVNKEDFKVLLRALNNTLFAPAYNSEFQNLKSKHYI